MEKDYVEQIRVYILNALQNPIDNEILISLYYKIGAYLYERDLSARELKILEWGLQTEFGIVIGFTKRNLISMIQFYKTYNISYLSLLTQIAWHQHLILLKIKDKSIRNIKLQEVIEHNKKQVITDYTLTEIRQLQQNLLCNK